MNLLRWIGVIMCLQTQLLSAQEVTPPAIELNLIYSGLENISSIASCGDDRLFVLEQYQADIEIIDTAGNYIGKFLDLTGLTIGVSERGLLGMAFHPDYAGNGYFFVNYTNPLGHSTIARYQVSANPDIANPASAQIILTINQPYTNHNGGHLAFGPDGYLYIGMGDGGGSGDPEARAQNPETMLGKMLRIDVDSDFPYSVPTTNPYVNAQDTLPEIWAFGLRNPWKYSFDRLTGDLWIADVGQNNWEEVNMEASGSAGGMNWGWRCYEGNAPFNTANCDEASAYDFPKRVYSHIGFYDFCSITGGYVYRGSRFPSLSGMYLLTDFCRGDFFGLTLQADGTVTESQLLFTAESGFTCFGEDGAGELYVGQYNGNVYRLEEVCGTFQPVIYSDGAGSLICDAPGSVWWWLDGAIIDGADQNTFTPSVSGSYYATASNSGGCVAASNSLEWLVMSGQPGCMYPLALNYNPEATVDDGSCLFGIQGCTYSNALNYSPLAQGDDGSCDFGIPGCTYVTAANFDPSAGRDDGSCIFPFGEDCPADLNGNGTVGVDDLTLFIAVFGSVCED
jgi:glucose/arabinose dehydrogenase